MKRVRREVEQSDGKWRVGGGGRGRASGENNNRVLTEGVPASAANEHAAPENSLQIKSLENDRDAAKRQPALAPQSREVERRCDAGNVLIRCPMAPSALTFPK